MPTMSIAAALQELKVLDARIQRGIAASVFVAAVQDESQRINGRTQAEFRRDAIGAWDSYIGLTTRRALVKQKIVESNAATKVTLAGEEMTVAAAIERRKHSIGYKRAMLKLMESQWTTVNKTIDTKNAAIRSDVEKQYAELMKQNPELAAGIINDAFARQALELVNPVELAAKIKAMTEEIEAFDSNFDLVINAANYATMIDV